MRTAVGTRTTPATDVWAPQGGRHMITALSCLTLEVYYRNLPLYKVDAEDNPNVAAAAAAGKDGKDATKDSKDATKDSKDVKKDPKDSKDAKKAVEKTL